MWVASLPRCLPAIAAVTIMLIMLTAACLATPWPVCRYGDATAHMGFCCHLRCPNTPHAWQLGWTSLAQLDGASLAPGQTVVATIAPQAQPGGASGSVGTGGGVPGLRIVPGWAAGADPVYLGFRRAAGGDSSLDPGLASRVHIYTQPQLASAFDPQPTLWQAALAGEDPGALVRAVRAEQSAWRAGRHCHAPAAAPAANPQPPSCPTPQPTTRFAAWPLPAADNQSWQSAASGLVVRIQRVDPAGGAVVSVCRRGGAETRDSCQKGLDNDCNGLTGGADPACRPALDAGSRQRTGVLPSTRPHTRRPSRRRPTGR